MNEVREIVFKLIIFVLQASFLPIIALFIAALFLERARRILLGIMIVVFILTMFTAFAVVTHPGTRYAGMEDLGAVLLDSLLSSLPVLLVLAIVSAAAWFARSNLVAFVYGVVRSRYLGSVMLYCEARSSGFIQLDSRAAGLKPVKGRRVVTGESGSGKTFLLHRLAAMMAKEALSSPGSPLPVWVEIDRLLAQQFKLDMPPEKLALLQPFHTPLLEQILDREMARDALCFFVDCSSSTFSLENADEVRRKLFRLMQFLAPNTFVISLPIAYQSPDIMHQFEEIITLAPLENSEVSRLLRALGMKGGATGQLRSLSSAWHNLARRPYLVTRLAQSAGDSENLPADLRALFQKTTYPPGLPPDQVEAGLSRLASEAALSGQYWLPARRVDELAGPDLADACRKAGLLVDLPALKGAQRTGFDHPLQLAYFTALNWYLTGQIGASLEAMSSNPMLVDALVFFNNLDSDSRRFTGQLLAIARQESPSALHLVVQCLMAMPEEARPSEVIDQVCASMLRASDFAAGSETGQYAWLVFKTLTPQRRAGLYEQVTAELEEESRLAILQQLAVLSHSPERRAGDLPEILEEGGKDFCIAVVKAWGEVYPDHTLDELCDLYQQGPVGRRAMAVECLGILPHDAAENYLRQAIEREPRPEIRVEILRALSNHARPGLFALLLSVVVDGTEAETVRAMAAQLLEYSDLPEPPGGISGLRDLIKAARMPLPASVRPLMDYLMEKMRRRFSDQIAAFESLANPFFANRPVSDPSMFFGRKTLEHALLSCIENRSGVLLYGERRVGKSSVFHQLQVGVSEAAHTGLPWWCVLVNVEVFDAQEFFYSLMAAVLQALDDPRLPDEPSQQPAYREAAFHQDLAQVVQVLRKSKGPDARLVLLLDHADRMLGFPAAWLEGFRRVIASQSLSACLVVMLAARQPLPVDHPLAGTLASYPITRLEPDEARELITAPLEGLLKIEPEAVALIEQSCQGHPFTIQALCQKLVNHAQSLGANTITVGAVRALLQSESSAASPRAALVEQAGSLMGGLIDFLEENPQATNAMVEEQMKRTFEGLREVMIRQVVRARKKT